MTAVQIPRDFTIEEVPFNREVAAPKVADNAPALGRLEAFKGTLLEHGFNTIFRPQNSSTPTDLPVPQPNSDNILELNMTVKSLSLSLSKPRCGPESRRGAGRHLLERCSLPAVDQRRHRSREPRSDSPRTQQSAIPGAGTDTIRFLVGDGAGPDANDTEMSAIFWVETVEAEIQVDQLDAGYSLDVSRSP